MLLQSFGATLEGLQRNADLVSTYALVFNQTIATQTARVSLLWPYAAAVGACVALLHTMGWVPHPIALKTNGTLRSLGVEYPINPGDSTSLALMKKKLVISLRAISIKKASARACLLYTSPSPRD